VLLAGALLPGAAAALSVDGRSQIHAVIGQPLAVAVPVSFAGVNPSTVTVRVVPSPDLPDEEEMVAASVQASYDAERSVVRLSTPRRLTVPALGLHLVVSAGSLVVNQDIDVLVDVPDLNAQHTAQAETPAADSETQGTAIRVLTVEKPAPQGRLYGDASARGGAGDDERPSVTQPSPPPPPDPRPKTWQVKQGETLSSISHSLAAAYHVPFEAMALALYEGNSEAFSPKSPEQALAGKRLQVPEDFVVQGEPPSRVAQFRAWLRRPDQPWKLRAFPSLLPDPAPRSAQDGAMLPWRMAESVAIVAGAAIGFLVWNFNPARTFMGDCGSNLLGLLLGSAAVLGSVKTSALVGLIAPLAILAVPFLDTTFVVLKRMKYRRPIHGADANHFHHRFSRIGFSPRRTVAYLYAWTISVAGESFST